MLLGIVVVNFVDFVWILVGDVGVFIDCYVFVFGFSKVFLDG